MDFKQLYEKAEKNAKKLERKVREADHEMKNQKHQQLERLAIERVREKMNLKRKIGQNASSHANANTNKEVESNAQQFSIPKKLRTIDVMANAGLENNKNPTSSKKEIYESATTSANTTPYQRKIPDNGHIIPRGTKTKEDGFRIAHQRSDKLHHPTNKSSKSNITPQKVKPTNNFEFKNLLEQAAKNDATAVEKLICEVESSSKKMHCLPVKKPRLESGELGITAGLNLKQSALRGRERTADAKMENSKAHEMKQKQRISHLIPSTKQNANLPANSATKLPNKIFQQSQTSKLLPMPTIASNKKPASSSQRALLQSRLPANKEPTSNKTSAKLPQNKPIVTANEKISKESTNVCTNLRQQEKRYLPGDIRYKAQAPPVARQVPNAMVAADKASTNNKKLTPTDSQKKDQRNGKTHQASSNLKQSKINAQQKPISLLTEKERQQRLNTQHIKQYSLDLQQSKKETQLNGAIGKPKMGLANNATKKEGLQLQLNKPRPTHAPSFKASRLDAETNSLARIKKESFDRLQMLKKQKERSRFQSAGPSSSSSRKYANYSETDEDEEDEEERYGDEYDSDLADFIDDSIVDDLQREDFEETLRIINPRYNKEKWLLRERMIDDRRMDARFKDVELEERRSAKLGLVEDIIEAKRGSKALA